MNSSNSKPFDPAHLRAWLETTRRYLFSDQEGRTNTTEYETLKLGIQPHLDSHGAKDRFVSRARGRLLRLMKHSAQCERNPLLELERAFKIQVLFIARHPEIPRRLLAWVSQSRDSRIQRRIRKVIGHYESRISRLIARARQQGAIKADIDPQVAAGIFIGLIQSLAIRRNLNLCQRKRLLNETFARFSQFRAVMITARGLTPAEQERFIESSQ